MLYDEVAVDPESLLHEKILWTLKFHFGWTEGRIVRNVPGNWKESCLQLANKLPDGLRKKQIKDLISRLSLLNQQNQPSKHGDWLDNVLLAHDQYPLSAIISELRHIDGPWYTEDTIEDYIEESRKRIRHLNATSLKAKDAEIGRAHV